MKCFLALSASLANCLDTTLVNVCIQHLAAPCSEDWLWISFGSANYTDEMNHCHLSLTTWLLITGPCFFSAQSVPTIRSWLWSIPVWELEEGTARVWGEPLVYSWLFGHSDRLLMLVGRTKRFSVCRSCSSVSTKNGLSTLSHSSTFGSDTPKKKYSFNSSHYSELKHLF